MKKNNLHQLLFALNVQELDLLQKIAPELTRNKSDIKVLTSMIDKRKVARPINERVENRKDRQKKNNQNHRLYKICLKALRIISLEVNNPYHKLISYQQDMSNLYRLGLFDLAKKTLNKGQHLAVELGNWETWLHFEIYRRAIFKSSFQGRGLKEFEESKYDVEEIKDKTKMLFEMYNLEEELLLAANVKAETTIHERVPSILAEILGITRAADWLDLTRWEEYSAFHRQVYIVYLQVLYFYYKHKQNYNALIEVQEVQYQVFKAHAMVNFDAQFAFLNVINNNINANIKNRRVSHIDQLIEELKDLKPTSAFTQKKIKEYIHYAQLIAYYLKADYNKITELSKDIWSALESGYEDNLSLARKLIIAYNTMVGIWLNRDMEKAWDWNELVLSLRDKNIRPDINARASLVRVLIQMDNEFDSYALTLAKSLRRKLLKSSRDYPLVCTILESIIKILSKYEKEEFNSIEIVKEWNELEKLLSSDEDEEFYRWVLITNARNRHHLK